MLDFVHGAASCCPLCGIGGIVRRELHRNDRHPSAERITGFCRSGYRRNCRAVFSAYGQNRTSAVGVKGERYGLSVVVQFYDSASVSVYCARRLYRPVYVRFCSILRKAGIRFRGESGICSCRAGFAFCVSNRVSSACRAFLIMLDFVHGAASCCPLCGIGGIVRRELHRNDRHPSAERITGFCRSGHRRNFRAVFSAYRSN